MHQSNALGNKTRHGLIVPSPVWDHIFLCNVGIDQLCNSHLELSLSLPIYICIIYFYVLIFFGDRPLV